VNWREAKALLDGVGKRRGPQDSLKIARNTVLERGPHFRPQVRGTYSFGGYKAAGDNYPENAIGLRLHETYVAILTPRWTELFTGGWHTMTTADRIRYVSGIDVRGSRGGWAVYLTADELPCYCATDGPRKSGEGIVIRGEWEPGKRLAWTREYDPSVPSANENGAPIYAFVTCDNCKGTGKRSGIDWDSGGYPFFDGIRVSADGRRIMRTQPHKPAHMQIVKTVSGWTGNPVPRVSRPSIYPEPYRLAGTG
jgi:hypothetical protein